MSSACTRGNIILRIASGRATSRIVGMQSGDPRPADNLKLLIEQKQNSPSVTCEVVSQASRWLKAELTGAGVAFQYAACDERDHYGFSVFTVTRTTGESQLVLEVKVAEIGGRPYAFAQVRSLGRSGSVLFPLFGEVSSGDGRELLLHYVSDFLLSTAGETHSTTTGAAG